MARSSLEVVVLRDNVPAREGLQAGHGLALLVRSRAGTVMLDTGDNDAAWVNADALGIDLTEITCIVLSHGHYDHTGGLRGLLRRLGGAMVTAHPGIFEPRFADRDGQRVAIGLPAGREEFEALGAFFQLSADPVTVAPGLITTGEVPRISDLVPHSPHLLVERDGQIQCDDFVDDMSLIVRLSGGDVLLTGCAHAGLINIVERATELAGRCPVAIAGGTHLAQEPEERIAQVAAELHARGVRQIAPMHCSGERGTELLAKHFPGETLRAGVGSTIVADETGAISVH